MSGPAWPTPQLLCRRCRKERLAEIEPEYSRFDFAGGHHELCLDCWRRWVVSPTFRTAAASPCPDRASLSRWLVEASA